MTPQPSLPNPCTQATPEALLAYAVAVASAALPVATQRYLQSHLLGQVRLFFLICFHLFLYLLLIFYSPLLLFAVFDFVFFFVAVRLLLFLLKTHIPHIP